MSEVAPIELTGRWWEAEGFTDELYLPGQSKLDDDGRKLLDQLAAKVESNTVEIPPMPKAAMEAMRLMREPDPEIEDVAACIQVDPAMTAQVLRHANSALYGARQYIDNVTRAAFYLGFKRLKSVLMKVALLRLGSEVNSQAYIQREWRFSTHCAAITRTLATKTAQDPEIAYVAGLLHDVGRIVVIGMLEKRGEITSAPEEDSNIEIILEVLHRGVGAQVAEAWELPLPVKDAVINHLTGRYADEPYEGEYTTTKLVEAAGDLCLAVGIGRFAKPFAILEQPSMVNLGLGAAGLESFLANDLPDTISSVTSFVG